MNKNLERIIVVPKGITVSIDRNTVTVKSGSKENVKTFDAGRVSIVKKDDSIVISAKKATRRESKMIGTIWAHLKNMLKGIEEDFVYTLEVCNVHFPMTAEYDKQKFRVLQELESLKKKQFESFTDQVRRNEAMREHMKKSILNPE